MAKNKYPINTVTLADSTGEVYDVGNPVPTIEGGGAAAAAHHSENRTIPAVSTPVTLTASSNKIIIINHSQTCNIHINTNGGAATTGSGYIEPGQVWNYPGATKIQTLAILGDGSGAGVDKCSIFAY